jgi:hydroxymethylglutaryl-CoA lyase
MSDSPHDDDALLEADLDANMAAAHAPLTLGECFPALAEAAGPALAALLPRLASVGLRRVRLRDAGLLAAERPTALATVLPCAGHGEARSAYAKGGADAVALAVAATEGASQARFGKGLEERWREVTAMVADAGAGFVLEGDLCHGFDCASEGPVPPQAVLAAAERFAALGVTRLVLCDEDGAATPPRVRDLLGWLHGALPDATLLVRFHDRRGTGLANTLAAVEAGLTHADVALGGAGGLTCTEDLAAALAMMGYETGLDLPALLAAGREAERLLGRALHSRVQRAGL